MNPLEIMKPVGEKVHDYVTQILQGADLLDPKNQSKKDTEKQIHATSELPLKNTGEDQSLSEIKTEIDVKKLEEEQEDTNPIIGIYRKHFIFMFKEWFSILILTTIFAILIYFITKFLGLNTYFSIFLTIIMVGPLLLRTFLTHVVDWQANAIIFREKNIVFFKYKGVFTQSTEVRSIAQIKSFDIIQSGIFQQFLNYGDIEVASMISGASKKIVLKDIYPVKEAYKVLAQHIESLEGKRGKQKKFSDNGSDLPDDEFDDGDDSDDE